MRREMKRTYAVFACILFVAIGFWLWSRQTQESRLQAIRDKGGRVYEIRPHASYVWAIDGLSKNVRDTVFGRHYGLCIGIEWRTDQASDRDIVDSLRVGHVIELDLSHSSVTDYGLAELGKNRSLEAVSLFDTQITGQGLIRLCEAPSLRKVDVRGTAATADAVQLCVKRNPMLMIESARQ